MPMIKKTVYEQTRDQFMADSDKMYEAKIAAQPESGAAAAIERLSKATLSTKPKENYSDFKPTYKQRDFDAEARGKVKCVMFEAALQSPAIAGLRIDSLEEFLKLVEKAADAGVAYTWK